MTNLEQSYNEYLSKGFILTPTKKLKKNNFITGKLYDRKTEPFNPKATGYTAVIPPEIIIVDRDSYEEGCEFDKLISDLKLDYTPEPFAITTSGGEHYAFANADTSLVVGRHGYKAVDIYAGYQSIIPIVGTTALNKQGEEGTYEWSDENFMGEIIINAWSDTMVDVFAMKPRVTATNDDDDDDMDEDEKLFEEAIKADQMPDDEVDKLLLSIPENVEYDQWLAIGMTLYDRYNGSDEGLKKFLAFGKRSPEKDNPDETIKKWENGHFKPDTITYKTLRSLANEGAVDTATVSISKAKTLDELTDIAEELSNVNLHTRGVSDATNRERFLDKLTRKSKDITGKPNKITLKKALSKVRPVNKKLEDFPDTVYTKAKGTVVLPTIANLNYFIDNIYHKKIVFDVILKSVLVDGEYSSTIGQLTLLRADIERELLLLGLNAKGLMACYDAMVYSHQVNPLRDFVANLPEWDARTDYIKELANMITTERANSEYVHAVMQSVCIQAVAAWDNKQHTKHQLSKLESVLVFVGGQGIGKTTWMGALMPDLMRHYFKDGVEFDPSDKDKLIQVTSAGLIELGELDATFSRSSISELKAFLSRTTDEFRAPYERESVSYPRQSVFVGTVNTIDVLKDSTGSRRFLPLDVKSLTLPSEELMLKVWAQAWHMYTHNVNWLLDVKWSNAMNSINSHFTDLGEWGSFAETIAEISKKSSAPKRKYSLTQLSQMLTQSKERLKGKERSDFINALEMQGIAKLSQGKYSLPADLEELYKLSENDESFAILDPEVDEFLD